MQNQGILVFECIATQVVAADELQSGQAIVLPGSTKRRDQDEGGFSICNVRSQVYHLISRYILIEVQVAMMIFLCEAAPLYICQKRCKEGQRWHSWNMIGIEIGSRECAM